MKKTVLIPLAYEGTLETARKDILQRFPLAGLMAISESALYLGILLGPGAGGTAWDKPLEKFERRSLLWSRLKLGIHYDVRMYAMFCFSVLAFYLQFYEVNQKVLDAEHRALSRIFTGPGNWCNRDDLRALGPILGASFRVPEVSAVSAASKQRLILKERFLARDRRKEIGEAMEASQERFILHKWHVWYSRGIIQSIFQAQDENVRRGINKARILQGVRSHEAKPSSSRDEVQKVVIRLMDELLPPVQARFIVRLRRWKLVGGELAVACRAVSILQAAYQTVAPRVAFTIFSTWWNRWATARRFQQKACCRFCGTAEDAIEHVAFCRVVGDIAESLFFLQRTEDRQLHWQNFLILRNGIGRNELLQRALFLQTILFDV